MHSKGTPWALVGHPKGSQRVPVNLDTGALKTLGHSKDTWTLKALGDLSCWTLRHLSTRTLRGHFGTQKLGHLGTYALSVLDEFYLGDSSVV